MADDNHIIRVIIQGYNKLSGVVKEAVDQSTPHLDKLNDRLKKSQKEADNTATSFSKMSDDMRRDGIEVDRTRGKIEKLGESVRKLRDEAKKNASLGPILSGVRAGQDVSSNKDAEIERRFQVARNARASALRQITLQANRDSLEADQRSKKEQARLRDQFEAEKLLGERRKQDLRDQYKIRKEQIEKEIELAKQLAKEGAISPDRVKELKDEIASRKRLIEDEKAAAAAEEQAIRRRKDAAISELKARRDALVEDRKRANADKDNKKLSKAAQDEAAIVAKKRGDAAKRRTEDIENEKAVAAVEISGVKEAARIRRQSHEDEIKSAEEQLKLAKPSDENKAAGAELVRELTEARKELGAQIKSDISEIDHAQKQSETSRKESVTDALRVEKQIIKERSDFDRRNLVIPAPNRANIARDVDRDSGRAVNSLRGIERAAAKVTLGLGDFTRGFSGARRGLAAFSGEAGKLRSTMTQVGAGFGDAFKNVNNFVNVRWNLILGALQLLGTLAVTVGANLVALAGSAVFAGAALGGALVAGIAQAVPVIGLLAATFQELQNAIKVVELRQKANNAASVDATAQAKAHKSAVQQLADAHYALKQAQQGVLDADKGIRDAHERVTDAMRSQKDAALGLAKARQDASRAIVDAAFAERDAELSLRDAQLGVLDAKQRLKDFEDKQQADKSGLKDAQDAVREAQARLAAAKAEGDQAEITTAQTNLAIANQNQGDIQSQVQQTATQHQELILGVQQAQLNLEKAAVTRRRATQENRTRQRQGVAGSPEVKAALDQQRTSARQLRDAIEGVAEAERRRVDAEHNVAQAVRGIANAQDQVTEASDKMSAAQRNAQREFNKLSLPEKNFVLAAERLVKAWKKLVRPLTDIITESVTRLIDSIIKVLQDPKIQDALKTLANSIADGIDKFGDFLKDPETRRQLTTFIEEAAKNMPTIVDLFLQLLHIVMDIAEASAPIFSGLLEGADSLLGRAANWTKRPEARTAPTDPRLSRLEPPGQTAPGQKIQGQSGLEKFLDRAKVDLDSWLKLIGAITKFLGYLFGGAEPSGNTLVGQLTKLFDYWANWLRDNPGKVHRFFERMRIALSNIAKILGPLIVKLVEAFSSKGAQDYTEFILTVVIPAIILLIEAVQTLTGWFIKLTKIPVVGSFIKWIAIFAIAGGLLTKLFPIVKITKILLDFGKAWRALGFISGFIKIFPRLAFAIELVGEAIGVLIGVFGIWLLIIPLIIIAIVLILKHFHLLGPALHGIVVVAKAVFGAFVDLVKTFSRNVIEFIQHPIRWLKQHWKALLFAVIMGPFNLLLTHLINHFFPGFQKAMFDGFVGAFRKIGQWFASIGGWINKHILQPIEHAFGINSPSTVMFDIGMDVVNGFLKAIKMLPSLVLGVFKKLPGLIANIFKGIGGKVVNKVKDVVGGLKGAVGGLFGHDDKKVTPEVARVITGEFARLHDKGIQRAAAIASEKKRHPGYADSDYAAFAKAAGYAGGGLLGGRGTDTVPAWLTPGEWVLNKAQQLKLAQGLGTSVENARMVLFGSKGASPKTGTVSGNSVSEHGQWTGYHNLDLHTSTDSYGNAVHFVRFKDGSWGQVTARAAARIAKSQGSWTPGYAQRASSLHGGFFETARSKDLKIKGLRSDAFDRRFALGGVVPAAAGGRMGPSVNAPAGRGGNTVEQNFNVNSEGESDWNAIMRIGAIHAQEAY